MVAGCKGDKVGLSEREVEKKRHRVGRNTEERGRDERDGCNTCRERGRVKDEVCEKQIMMITFLNDVLYINKHHILFAVIFKAFPLGIYGVSI